MNETSEPLGSLWDELRTEAETSQVSTVELPTTRAPRRRSLTEKFTSAVLSGYLPSLLLLLLGLGAGSAALGKGSDFAILLALGTILAVPFAGLLGCLFRTEELSPPRLLLLTVLGYSLGVIGLTSQPAWVCQWLYTRGISSPYKGDLEMQVLSGWAESLDTLFRSLSAPTTWAGLLLFLVLIPMLKRARYASPWVQPAKPAGRLRRSIAGLLLLAPWLALGGALGAKGQILTAKLPGVENRTVPSEPPRTTWNAWVSLSEQARLADSAWARDSERLPSWDLALQQQLEERSLTLVRSGRLGTRDSVSLLDGLLRRPENLKAPLELSWAALQACLEHHPYGVSHQADRVGQLALKLLSKQPMTDEQLQASLLRVQALLALIPDPLEEADLTLATHLAPEASRGDLPAPFSDLIREFETQRVLAPWLRLRQQVVTTDLEAMDASVRRLTAELPSEGEARWRIQLAAGSCYGLQLRPQLETARQILERRLNKAGHHSYPKTRKEEVQ